MSVVSIAEIRHGIEQLAHGRRRTRLLDWLENELVVRLERRILNVDQRIAAAWGVLMRRAEVAGAPPEIMDAFVAATASVHGLTVVTRNTRDFAAFGVPLLDPWRASTDT